jgi:hypothetical protein
VSYIYGCLEGVELSKPRWTRLIEMASLVGFRVD